MPGAAPSQALLGAPVNMANILVTLFAVGLCLVNTIIWAFVSEMPLVGLGWLGAAAGCLMLHKWSKG